MGIRDEKKDLYKYARVYRSLKIESRRNNVTMMGKINDWEETGILSRIFYKLLEELLYSRDIERVIYERAVKKKLKKHNLLDKSLFDVLYSKKFNFERMKILLMSIDDYVYFHVKKFLPYIRDLSLVTSAANELLENTIKYSSGDFYLTAQISDDQNYPLLLSIENRYKTMNGRVTNNLNKLKEDIEDVNNMNNSPEALHTFIRKLGAQQYEKEIREEFGFGLAKIRFETGALFSLVEKSEYFGENGITLSLKIPITLLSKDELLDKVKEIFSR